MTSKETPSRWDRLLENFDREVIEGGKRLMHGMDRWTGAFFPIDVEDTKDTIQVKVDLPGMKKDQVYVEADEKSLVIAGERPCPESRAKSHSYYERPCGPFKRVIYLPSNAKVDDIKAAFQEGVLGITIPKATPSETSKTIRIE